MSERAPHERGRESLRPVVFCWILLVAVTSVPYLRASALAPPGKTFVGFFYSIPDVMNYLFYVQQAEDGAFVFTNKLVTEEHPAALVNLEWWTVGRLSAFLDRRPALAYRVFGALATLAILLAADRWLRFAGLPDGHRLPALILVFTGAGLGGIRYLLLGPPAWRSVDLVTGMFPFVCVLVNPHFVIGTALLLWGLLAFTKATDWRGNAVGILLGTALGLVRPYDLAMLGSIRTLAVLTSSPPSTWLRRLGPMAGLLPVVAYNYWLFYRNPDFAVLAEFPYQFPPFVDYVIALTPALALATAWWPTRAVDGSALLAQRHLLVWVALGLALTIRPVAFFQQALTSLGLPILSLAAIGLARFKPAATLLAAATFCSTGVIALRILTTENGLWFEPSERVAVAKALRSSCSAGDVVFCPAPIGMHVNALTSCRAYISHPVMRDFAAREEAVRRFYEATDPAWRAALLDKYKVQHLALPGDAGPRPEQWLGAGTSFVRGGRVVGPTATVSLYHRGQEP